jgi:hypothetical protein
VKPLIFLAFFVGVADAADLEPRGTDWNGLSRLVGAFEKTGLKVETPPALDLGDLDTKKSLALLDPDGGERIADLRRFVQDGGRLLLAAEGPGADPLLVELGIRRADAPAEGQPRLGGHPALVVLRGPDTGLLAGVRDVVANHPGAFAGPDGLEAAMTFADGTPFLYHLRLGAGEVVVVADASVFINLMQDAGDNARLVATLGARLAGDGDRPVVVAAGAVPLAGRYRGIAPPPAEGLRGRMNAALEALRVATPDGLAVRFFVALALAGTVLYAFTVFPGGARSRRRPLGPSGRAPRADALAGRPGGPAAPDATHPKSLEKQEREVA